MSAGKQLRIGIALQARMNSRRLPGKVLMRIGERSILQHLVEACREVRSVDSLCVATSAEPSDDAIASHCEDIGVAAYRGPLDDVAGRYLGATAAHRLDAVVRISADSPLMPPPLVEAVVEAFRNASDCDLATNVLRRTYPSGMSVEVIRAAALAKVHPLMDTEQREHVTPYFYAHPDAFSIASVERDEPLTGFKLSVDTPDDFAFVSALMSRLERPASSYDIDELANLARQVTTEAAP